MIVPMKHVTLLCLLPEQESTLGALRDLGVVHVTPVVTPESEDLERLQDELAQAREAFGALESEAEAGPEKRGSGHTKDAADVVSEARALLLRRKEAAGRVEALEREAGAQRPFGHFDPEALKALAAGGVHVHLCQLPSREGVPVVDGATLHVVGEDKGTTYVAVVSRGEISCPGREVSWPERSLEAVEAELAEVHGRLRQASERLAALGSELPVIRRHIRTLETREQFLLARDGMGTWERVAYLEGFCPDEKVSRLQEAAADNGWGLIVRDPAPGESVPTLLRSPWWVRPIQAVFDILGILPGYREIDISACFLLFFALFFAMLVGDAGYGAIFLLLTLLARRKWPAAPPQPFALMAIMSVATLTWGMLTGTYFGLADPPEFLLRFKVGWLSSEDNLKQLCFLIGTAHLMIAHAWNGWVNRRTWQALAQLGWIGTTLCMYHFSMFMVQGAALPGFVIPVLSVSVALIVLFMTPPRALKDEWFNHVMLPLSLVSNFMDVISYVRLYAVGMASLALAMAFNEMAAGFGPGWGRVGAAVVLLLGHSLNLVLSVMGVMVHGVRLNALEFSSHIGLSWTGVAFQPFANGERKAGPDGSR